MAALHDEIARLPEKYRLPIVLCCVGANSRRGARKLGGHWAPCTGGCREAVTSCEDG